MPNENPELEVKREFNKIYYHSFFFFVLIVLNIGECLSQPGTWQRTLNNRRGSIVKVQQTNDGGYISFGSDFVNNSGYLWETWLQKYSPLGDTVWKKIFNERSFFCYWGQQTSDKGFILCGEINDDSSFSSDIYLLKTDSLGNRLWGKTIYSGNDIDQGYCVKQTNDGGYIILARVDNLTDTDVGLFKTDGFGNVIWSKIYGDDNRIEYPFEIKELTSGGYIAVGTSTQNKFSSDILVMRFDNSGDSIWTKAIGGVGNQSGISIDFELNQGYIIGGSTFDSNTTMKGYVVKTDTLGNVLWSKSYPTSQYEQIYSARSIIGRGFVLAGYTDSESDVQMAKVRIIDFSGDLIFENSFFPGDDENIFRSIELANDGGFIAAGHTTMLNSNRRMYIVKMDSLLNANPIAVHSEQFEIPYTFEIRQNYPNPFNSSTIISYSIKKTSEYEMILFDVLGRVVSLLFKKSLQVGDYRFDLNLDKFNLSSGIYFYTLSNFDFKDNLLTKKLVYLK